MKHSKKTWKAVRKTGTHIHRIVDQDGAEIADTLMPYGLGELSRREVVEQAEFNAKLIAAAPRLLEACKEMAEIMEHNAGLNGIEYENNPAYIKVVKAISLAQ